MRRCAFLTTDQLDGFVTDDERAHAPLAERGWHVEPVSWHRSEVDWSRFEAVVIRTPWDYHNDLDAFLTTLEHIDHSSARLENDLRLVQWNAHKTYLRDLEARGVPTIPTRWEHGFSAEGAARRLFDELDAAELVVKPTVGAGADDTFRLTPTDETTLREAEGALSQCSYMAQPFVRSIVEEGEYSVFFFDGAYSHTILKIPASGDFRVQEEHGGLIRAVEAEPSLLDRARQALNALPSTPLYARVDLARTAQDTFALMELELIEPSLYFRTDPRAPARFADAFAARMQRRAAA